jgi:hypothetical protein
MKGWLDNFGKADNANDSNVSLPEGFVGLGYNTKGRNYSPAWGGQFQKGGNVLLNKQILGGGQQSTIQPTIPYLTTKDPAEFYKSWIQSPEYEQRLNATGYGNLPDKWLDGKDVGGVDYTKQQRLDLLENIKPFEYNKYKKSEAKPFDVGGPTININPLDYEGSARQSIEAHEIAHVGTPTMSYQESEIIRNAMLPMKEPVLSGVQGSKERDASRRALEDFKHLQKPEEAKADLDALRFMMYDKGIYDITKGQKFTESDFEKAKQNLGKDRVFKRLENRMGKKNFVKLMNTIASADSEELPMAMGGMSIPGSVGFTYARTAGSAPSEGKYAKKTMASAQKGKKITQDATRVDSNASDKIWGIQRELDAQNLSDDSFREKYGMPLHQFKMRDSEYSSAFNRQMEQRRMSDPNYAELNLPQTDVRSKIYQGNPNLRFIPGTSEGESRAAMEDLFLATTTATAPLLPVNTAKIAKGAQQIGKYLTDDTFLKNAWRLNPKAYQYNLPENTMWRGIGKEGMEDAVSSGVFRAKQNVEPSYFPNSSLNLNKSFGANTYFTPKFGTAASYSPDYLAEVPRSVANWRNRYKKSDWSQIADRQIPVNEGRILQKNWLKGYEEIPQKQNGDDIPSAQNGQEMKFYQNGLDWKPKSMQNGGDEIYQGLELPEFVVEGKDERMKEAMSQGIRKFYGHVGELMGAPQKEMMQLITGKEQTPSEAWGFQNTGGLFDSYSSFGKNVFNFGLDNFIDPVNAIPGVGLVDDLTRGAVRGAAQDAVSKTLKYGVSPYSYSPEVLARIPENLTRAALGKPKSLPKAVTEITEKNPQVRRTVEDTYNNREDAWSVYLGLPPENKGLRLVGSDEATGLSKYELTKPRVMSPADVKDYRKVIDRSTINKSSKTYLDLNQPGDTVVDSDKLFGVMGGYSKFISPDGKNIMYRDVWDLQPFSRLTSEELPTKLGESVRNFEASSLIPGAKPFVSEGKLADIKTKYYPAKPYKDIKTRFNEQLGYVSNYYEPEAFIKDIDNPTAEEIFNYDQMLRDVAKKSLMQRIKNEKTFLNPLRNQDSRKYADFAPYIKVDKSKKKDGGIVKDNEGYWNPENWGKPVEIDSNDITMEGVYEPLLGVSDTGDAKLMKPGKNYKFKGKKVTEFPVAELGINQLDAQPMKKLNQLLNFTNNPDKDNWLDKYN